MKRKFTHTALLMLSAILAGAAQARSGEAGAFDSVDPTIGTTHCRWFFYTPGAMPFGMAKPGPCTDAHRGAAHGWDAIGYDSRQDSIESFVSFREFQIGGVAIMATTGRLITTPGEPGRPDSGYRSRFDRNQQIAKPGYYSVDLKDYGIRAELTATPRVAYHRFTFPAGTNANIILDVGNWQGESGPVLDAFVRQTGPEEFEGFVETLPIYVKAYQPGASVKMYFVAQLDGEPSITGAFRGTNTFPGQTSIQGAGAGIYASFTNTDAKPVVLKLGMSYTSVANARLNFETEAKNLSFDDARRKSQVKWEEMLGRIKVEGGATADRVKFYTGLYHALLGRGLASDVNGDYSKNDGGIGHIPTDASGKPKYNHYNSDSVWGVFWNLAQLWALAYPDYFSEYVRCHLDICRDCGWLPDSIATSKFVSGVGTDFMGVIVSSAYQLGVPDLNAQEAFAAVEKNELGWQNRPLGAGKADVKSFLDRGYVPLVRKVPAFSGSTADGSLFSASHTMEYCFSAYAASQFAGALGKTNEAATLEHYSRGWEKLYDAQTDYIRPRNQEGEFIEDFDPKKPWIGFQEGNALQYTFYVPQDPAGLIKKMGLQKFRERLAWVFETAEQSQFGGGTNIDAFSGLEGAYNQGNQPCLHIPWLFNYAGEPELTQHWVRRICDVFYGTDAVHGYGYGQDEDQGQLGAWYVMAAIGLFDVQGGASRHPMMQMNTPLFQSIDITPPPGQKNRGPVHIRIKGDARSNEYIAAAKFNGNPMERREISWSILAPGGMLEIEVTNKMRHPASTR